MGTRITFENTLAEHLPNGRRWQRCSRRPETPRRVHEDLRRLRYLLPPPPPPPQCPLVLRLWPGREMANLLAGYPPQPRRVESHPSLLQEPAPGLLPNLPSRTFESSTCIGVALAVAVGQDQGSIGNVAVATSSCPWSVSTLCTDFNGAYSYKWSARFVGTTTNPA